MRIEVDLDKCTGHGICESIAEEVFEVGDDGAVVIHDSQRPESGDPLNRRLPKLKLCRRLRDF